MTGTDKETCETAMTISVYFCYTLKRFEYEIFSPFCQLQNTILVSHRQLSGQHGDFLFLTTNAVF